MIITGKLTDARITPGVYKVFNIGDYKVMVNLYYIYGLAMKCLLPARCESLRGRVWYIL